MRGLSRSHDDACDVALERVDLVRAVVGEVERAGRRMDRQGDGEVQRNAPRRIRGRKLVDANPCYALECPPLPSDPNTIDLVWRSDEQRFAGALDLERPTPPDEPNARRCHGLADAELGRVARSAARDGVDVAARVDVSNAITGGRCDNHVARIVDVDAERAADLRIDRATPVALAPATIAPKV